MFENDWCEKLERVFLKMCGIALIVAQIGSNRNDRAGTVWRIYNTTRPTETKESMRGKHSLFRPFKPPVWHPFRVAAPSELYTLVTPSDHLMIFAQSNCTNVNVRTTHRHGSNVAARIVPPRL